MTRSALPPCTILVGALLVCAVPVSAQLPTNALRVCAGGDVLLGSNLDTTWVTAASARVGRTVSPVPDLPNLVQPLADLAIDADVILLNIEGAVGEGPAPTKCRPGSTTCYAFRQPLAAATALRGVLPRGFVVGNVANNHAMDAGVAGFEATVRHLEAAHLFVTGVDTLATFIPVPMSGTVAFLGFSPNQAGPDPRNLTAVRRHVRRAAAVADWVVVTMHMGAEGASAQRTRDTTEIFLGENRGNVVAFARAAADAGAHVVVGHGPHVLRAMEWWRGSFIAYSLGNLLTYGPFNLNPPRDAGGLLCVVLGGPRDGEVELRSTRQRRPGTVAADPTFRAVSLVDSLSRMDFPDTRPAFDPSGITRRPRR